MFANGHTDYGGPSRIKASTGATKVKKVRKAPKASSTSSQQPEQVDSSGALPPSRPFVLAGSKTTGPSGPPLSKPVPPPSRPFVLASKILPREVIEFPTSESDDEALKNHDTEYEDASQGKKRKLVTSGGAHRVSKKHGPSADNDVEPKTRKKQVQSKSKLKEILPPKEPLPASPSKGGPLSPLTVSSSDEPLPLETTKGEYYRRVLYGCSSDYRTETVQPAKRLRDGSDEHPLTKGAAQ
jgi:hypothetical protein